MSQSRRNRLKADEIDASLRRAFDEIVQEDLPPRLASLMEQLRQADRAASGGH